MMLEREAGTAACECCGHALQTGMMPSDVCAKLRLVVLFCFEVVIGNEVSILRFCQPSAVHNIRLM